MSVRVLISLEDSSEKKPDSVKTLFRRRRSPPANPQWRRTADKQVLALLRGLVIRPSYAKFFNRRARKTLYADSHPLTLIAGHQSALLTDHIRAMTARLGKDWRA